MRLKGKKKAYYEYLRGKKWAAFRIQALEYHGNRCGRCGSKFGLQVHHKTYKNLYKETFADVMLLCNSCHYVVHRKHNKNNSVDSETITYYPNKTLLC